MTAFLAGFALSLSLILAIGAQNAFVLRQGIRRAHVGLIVLTCSVSEAIVIFAGVAGFGAMIEAFPAIEPITRWGGAAFILGYGLLSLRRAIVAKDALSAAETGTQSAKSAFLTCLAMTFLNPHFYLDTLVLIGAVAAQYGAERWVFGMGAFTASAVFFVLLGYGARALEPFFAKPSAWRVLDAAVGILMVILSFAVIMA
ncbi:MAG: LysE/ArgO family amino acid transporter [Paracoccaceae bacterium]